MKVDLSIRTFLREAGEPGFVPVVIELLCVVFICAQIVRLLLAGGAL